MPERSTADSRFAYLHEALAGRDGVTLGSGKRRFGSDALQVHGRIFAMLRGGRLFLKLPRDRVAALLASGAGSPFDAGKGRPMKEWVVLEPRADQQWVPLATEALTFVAARSTSARPGRSQ
jgi:TfoX/Sxy family transcriptional regulator of competence genes